MATGEKEMFEEIWLERVKYCENCGCETHFCEHCSDEVIIPRVINFDHIEAKSRRKDLRLVKSNIALLCAKCHIIKTQMGKTKFEERKREYKLYCNNCKYLFI